MREIPTGGYPAAAIAASMLNWEASFEKFDVGLAAQNGTLQVLPIEKQTPYYLSITHLATPKHFRVRPTAGQIYLTPWPGGVERGCLVAEVMKIMDKYESRPRLWPSDIAQHEILWENNRAQGAESVTSSPDHIIINRPSGFVWTIGNLGGYWADLDDFQGQSLRHIQHSVFSLVVDLAGAPKPIPERDSYWIPHANDFGAPTVIRFALLILIPGPDGRFEMHRRDAVLPFPWKKMRFFENLPTLEVACPRLEAAHHRAALQAHDQVCCICKIALLGRCEALLPQKGSAVPLCFVCGAGLRALHCSRAPKILEFRDQNPEWVGSMVEWSADGLPETCALDTTNVLWKNTNPDRQDALPLLGVYFQDDEEGRFEFDIADVRELGVGRLYSPEHILVLTRP
jgi:hypothetical protein